MSVAVSCPFCNAEQPATAAPAGRIVCVRCGESFPVSGAMASASAIPAAILPPMPPRPPRRWPLLAALALVALTGLAVTMAYWPRRTGSDGGPTEVRDVPPAELAGLGWLPNDPALLAGVHVAQARRTPAGRDLLARFRLGDTPEEMAYQERNFGIRAADIDHLVTSVELALPPSVTVVVVTRSPVDAAAVRERLKATEPIPAANGGRPVSRFKPEGAVGEGVLWCPAERVLVYGWFHAGLARVPREPTPPLERLSAGMTEAVRDRLPADAVTWATLDVPEGLGFAEPFLRRGGWLPDAEREAVQQLRQLAVGLRPGDPLRAELAARGPDEAITARLDKALRSWSADRGLTPDPPADVPTGWAVVRVAVSREKLAEAVPGPK